MKKRVKTLLRLAWLTSPPNGRNMKHGKP
jgi:hypothetical protein